MEDPLEVTPEDIETFSGEIEKLDKDIIKAIKDGRMVLEKRDIRYLVDFYYQLQEYRKSARNIERASKEDEEPSVLVQHLAKQQLTLEKEVKSALVAWSSIRPECAWPLSVYGIGPVISSGLIAHVNMEKTQSIGALWRFSGVDPTSKWEKGKKRPWNARLKVLVWKIGDSFRKFSNSEKCLYGKVYRKRKAYETSRNDRGEMKETAEKALKTGRWKKETVAFKCYTEGKLPPGQIDARSTRYAAKLFLAHWWEKEYRRLNGKAPPLPYPIAILGHKNYIPPPGQE